MNKMKQGSGWPAFGRSTSWVLAAASVGLGVHACQVDKGGYAFANGGVGGGGGLGAASGLAGAGRASAGNGGRAPAGVGAAGDSSAGDSSASDSSAGDSSSGGSGDSSSGGSSSGGSSSGASSTGGSGDSSSGGSPSGGTGGGGETGACGAVVCASEAKCVSTSQPPRCECPDGYLDVQGDGSSCEDIDECATDNGGCDPLTECANTPGSFSCGNCPLGYMASPAGACIDIDECATNNGGCDETVTCNNSAGSFTCGDCPAGYSGGGKTGCIDIDECATNNGGCHVSADCENTEGSRECTCKEGYSGTGLNCTCAVATTCVNSTTLRSCVNNTVTQTTCTGPSALCVAGQGCQTCNTQRCGTTCCAAPPTDAVTICSPADTCSAECKPNFHSCGNTQTPCYADSNPARCGDDCVDCTQPNATAKCEGGECANTCKGTALGCVISAGKPACGSWSFESSKTENLELVAASTTASTGLFKAMQSSRATDGSYVLAVGYDGTSASTDDRVDVKIPLCPSGQGVMLTNRALRMDMYHETASGSTRYPDNRSGHYVRAYNGSEIVSTCDWYPNSDTRTALECPIETATLVTHINVQLRIFEPWKGTIYIDNVRLE